MEKILVAFDGSEKSKKCLSLAIKLAGLFESYITVFYVAGQTVVGPMISSSAATHSSELQGTILPIPGNMRDLMTKEALDVLSQTREDVEKLSKKIDYAIVFGDPASEIVKEAEKGYDLIVIGYHSTHSTMLSLGNVAEKVTKNAPCSVLVFK
ncbi:MAG: universal stress protein [Nitrososphaeria archaeon]|jgi:nucleotide-binding universal stress UspA family protein